MFKPAQLRRRMNRVRVLLATRNDYLPTPGGIELGSLPGPAEGRRVPCRVCRGKGRALRGTRQGARLRICMRCDGTGLVQRVAGEPGYDEYVEAFVGGEQTPAPRAMTARELDESIARLERIEAEREGRINHARFGWEAARKQRDATGSYRELEHLLELLRWVECGRLSRAVELTYGCGVPAGLVEQRAVLWIAERMPPKIRIPEWAWDEETDRLRAEAKELSFSMSTREVAEAMSLSPRRVKALVATRTAA